MQRMRTTRPRRSSRLPEITLTPLIDTALTLLIIFMVTAPMMNNAIRVNLPKGKAREDAGAQELVVSIDKNGKLFFNSKAMTTKDMLIAEIKQTVGSDHERTVFVKADEAVRYGQVLELVDNIKVVGGISYVALATKPV